MGFAFNEAKLCCSKAGAYTVGPYQSLGGHSMGLSMLVALKVRGGNHARLGRLLSKLGQKGTQSKAQRGAEKRAAT